MPQVRNTSKMWGSAFVLLDASDIDSGRVLSSFVGVRYLAGLFDLE